MLGGWGGKVGGKDGEGVRGGAGGRASKSLNIRGKRFNQKPEIFNPTPKP